MNNERLQSIIYNNSVIIMSLPNTYEVKTIIFLIVIFVINKCRLTDFHCCILLRNKTYL